MKESKNYILGLDIGANSIGWAVFETAGGEPSRLADAGVRVFEAGVEGNMESAKDVSRATARREARLHRRQLARRAKRAADLAVELQKYGFLPNGDVSTPEARKVFFDNLDSELADGGTDPAMLPYRLRARALDEKLEPHQTGRAIYHLAHRRGFLSNRKSSVKKNEEEGVVKESIKTLENDIANSGARTLGEYLSKLDPAQERIRARWTSRRMISDEFDAIWSAQAPHYPEMFGNDAKTKIFKTIFFQKPIRSQKGTIGHCEFERSKRRAPLAIRISQRFRVLQKVNDLKVKAKDPATGVFDYRKLTDEERTMLLSSLEIKGDMSFPAIKKLFKLDRKVKFNFEEGGEEKMIGDRTAAKLAAVFGEERWRAFTHEEKNKIIELIYSTRKDSTIAKAGREKYGLNDEQAKALSETALEDGHISLSRQAIAKLLPLMEEGVPYATAVKKVYDKTFKPRKYDLLPQLDKSGIMNLTNPAVKRSLTELRKVVNAIVKKYGIPETTRIELARDLKRSRKEREKIWKENNARRKHRERVFKEFLEKQGRNPSGRDVEKMLLWEECKQQCPYTGKQISFGALFGPQPQFDIEHIIPFSRCLDNSFLNKTLCDVNENRNRKKNKTPWEAYHGTPEWDEILKRVRNFSGDAAAEKSRRFQLDRIESIDDFATRQLNETRYTSKLAMQYIGLLYGAGVEGVDPDGRRRVQAARGRITAYLRDALDLNGILGDGGEKSRTDHRHHIIDAVCVGLTDAGMVKRLSDAAAQSELKLRKERFGSITSPWPGFQDDVRFAVESALVSHRPTRKVSGPLHAESVYGKVRLDENGKQFVSVRKAIPTMSAKMINDIIDPIVKNRVREKLVELGVAESAKAFKSEENFPSIVSKTGKRIPIKSARIKVYEKPTRIGSGARSRNVQTSSNHHIEVFEVTDAKGRPKWEGRIVTMLEACNRLSRKEPVVDRTHTAGGKFVFSLHGGDIISLDEKGTGERNLYRIRTLTKNNNLPRAEYVAINDAREEKEIKKKKQWSTALMEPLRKKGCKKMEISPLGEISEAHD